ncbi:hypothetical protein K491DRAFT_758523 [Lophiostoma macrostomum CBS 122681]|uniref:Uncharacterized protein n=1 Tax=Lophiostoma macrostomum CBS 122681 TaxID=1314788 RepID=A0A6A6T5B7_9PLEO|nr:hypothetical protein K491DRAFT_758523 [Lophiostoma macrostomum CBS 122681]
MSNSASASASAGAPVPLSPPIAIILENGATITEFDLDPAERTPILLPLAASPPPLPALIYRGVEYSYLEFLRGVAPSAEAFSFLLGVFGWPASSPPPTPRWCFLKLVERHRDGIVGAQPTGIGPFSRALEFFRAWLSVHHKVEPIEPQPSGAWWCDLMRRVPRLDPMDMTFERSLRAWWSPSRMDAAWSCDEEGRWDSRQFLWGLGCLLQHFADMGFF